MRWLSELGPSAQAHDKILRVARTTADLAGEESILSDHVSEAIMYKTMLSKRLPTILPPVTLVLAAPGPATGAP